MQLAEDMLILPALEQVLLIRHFSRFHFQKLLIFDISHFQIGPNSPGKLQLHPTPSSKGQ
jgi:hypothetical protein